MRNLNNTLYQIAYNIINGSYCKYTINQDEYDNINIRSYGKAIKKSKLLNLVTGHEGMHDPKISFLMDIVTLNSICDSFKISSYMSKNTRTIFFSNRKLILDNTERSTENEGMSISFHINKELNINRNLLSNAIAAISNNINASFNITINKEKTIKYIELFNVNNVSYITTINKESTLNNIELFCFNKTNYNDLSNEISEKIELLKEVCKPNRICLTYDDLKDIIEGHGTVYVTSGFSNTPYDKKIIEAIKNAQEKLCKQGKNIYDAQHLLINIYVGDKIRIKWNKKKNHNQFQNDTVEINNYYYNFMKLLPKWTDIRWGIADDLLFPDSDGIRVTIIATGFKKINTLCKQ